MTEKTEQHIRLLKLMKKEMGKQGCELKPDEVAVSLRKVGLRPTETGWVLRHVFGMDMADAVHRATVCVDED